VDNAPRISSEEKETKAAQAMHPKRSSKPKPLTMKARVATLVMIKKVEKAMSTMLRFRWR